MLRTILAYDRLPALAAGRAALDVRIVGAGYAALAADLGHVPFVPADGLAAFASDLRHMFAVTAYRFAALAARFRMSLRIAVPAPAGGACDGPVSPQT